jgi:hypothetical protein
MKHLLALTISTVSFACAAQEPPPVVRSLFENLPVGHHVLPQNTLSKDQRDLNNKSTTKKDGFLKVQVSPEYLAQLGDIDVQNWLTRGRYDSSFHVDSSSLLGRFQEGLHRTNFVFGEGARATAMLTVWNFVADGATVVTVTENQNQKIGAVPATLSLALADNHSPCLWKVFAIEGDVAYEFVMSDYLQANGEPKLSPKRVMAIATSLVESFKNRTLD